MRCAYDTEWYTMRLVFSVLFFCFVLFSETATTASAHIAARFQCLWHQPLAVASLVRKSRITMRLSSLPVLTLRLSACAMTVIGNNDYNEPKSLLEIAAGQVKCVRSLPCAAKRRTDVCALDRSAAVPVMSSFSPTRHFNHPSLDLIQKYIFICIFSLIHT